MYVFQHLYNNWAEETGVRLKLALVLMLRNSFTHE